jgi:hypothetical protein
MRSVDFLCLASSSSWVILSQAHLLEVPVTYLGFHGYYLARGPVLLNGCSSKKLMLYGGSKVCILLSLVLYPKHFYCLDWRVPSICTTELSVPNSERDRLSV